MTYWQLHLIFAAISFGMLPIKSFSDAMVSLLLCVTLGPMALGMAIQELVSGKR